MLRVLAVRVGARKRGPSGDLTAETRVRPVSTRYWPVPRSASPQAGRLSRRSRGPNFKLGMRPEIRRKRIAPPPSIASEVRSPNRKCSGPLFRSTAIPAQRSTGPRHCRGLAPCLTPISQVFRSMMDCCQIDYGTGFQGSRVIPRISETGHLIVRIEVQELRLPLAEKAARTFERSGLIITGQ